MRIHGRGIEVAGNAADRMSDRLRADLRIAMRAREAVTVSVIRALLAAIDNAQAVPIDPTRQPAVLSKFGDEAIEVPRLALSTDDLMALLHREIAHRQTVADEIRPYGREEEADRAIAEAEIIARYLEDEEGSSTAHLS